MDEINPGIRRCVALLRAAGFETVDSGDGETHDYDCDREVGYVACRVRPGDLAAETDRLTYVLRRAGVRVELRGMEDRPDVCHVQGSYAPGEPAVIDASPLHDRMLAAEGA